MAYIRRMRAHILFLAACAAILLPAQARAARAQDTQQVMTIDLNACPRPHWPAAALAQGAGGVTTVEVQIGEQGLVTDARVLTSSGRTDLDEAALAGIRRCVFHAVLATGQAPTGWLKTQYVWVSGEAKQAQAAYEELFARTRQLADAGDAAAQNTLGTWYQRGTYVKADLAQAAAWYLLAAQNGNAYAQNNLGVLYFRGAGVPHDPKQAAEWYAKAAEQGHGWAQANLAWAYEHGTTGERDPDIALYWLTRSADGGLAAAQLRLGLQAMRRAVSDAERSAAAAWLARAAAQNDPDGLYYLGRSHELGLGNMQDDVQAVAAYRKALGRSAGRAEAALAMLIEAGRAGSAAPDEAASLYRKAMQWRHPGAYYRYGLILEQHGDDQLAAAVFRQGAALGDCEAATKYLQLRQAQRPSADAPTSDIYLAHHAQACAARPELPPQL